MINNAEVDGWDAGQTAPRMSLKAQIRPKTVAPPSSHSSMTQFLVSGSRLLIRDFHGVNCETIARRDNPRRSGETNNFAECLGIERWNPRSEFSATCDPRDGATRNTQANKINVADRPRIMPSPVR